MWKTGETVPRPGMFAFVRYVQDERETTPPKNRERVVALDEGQVFPVVRSQSRAAWYCALI